MVTIGVAHGLEYGIRTPNIGTREDYWLISQLHIIGGRQAMDIGGTGWKIVGNNIECPGADGQVGCVETSQSSHIRFYGNEVHNVGAVRLRQSFITRFISALTPTILMWAGTIFTIISRAAPCSSIRRPYAGPVAARNDETGRDQFDLHVHDNLIHGDSCNGINFATVDPSKGPVEAYNNVIYHIGWPIPGERRGLLLHLCGGHHNHGR